METNLLKETKKKQRGFSWIMKDPKKNEEKNPTKEYLFVRIP